ncbi:hypothetical protein [Microbacterium luteum]|uniref:hypothetical protein n=1 Tax=Microbacterium luteum TaxID=2782167 RepID=UPI0018897CD7|nr:hypothetical protein [Microbacterium luteum]
MAGPSSAELWEIRRDGLRRRFARWCREDGRRRAFGFAAMAAGVCVVGVYSVAGLVAAHASDDTASGEYEAVDAVATSFHDYQRTIQATLGGFADCVSEAGFAAVIEEQPFNDGIGVSFPNHGSQDQQQFDSATDECWRAVPAVTAPWGDAAFRSDAYAWISGRYDCIVEAGFMLPSRMSEEEFTRDLDERGVPGWDPVSDAVDRLGGEHVSQAAVLEACPSDIDYTEQ